MSRLHRLTLVVVMLIGYLSVNFSSYGPSLTMYFMDVGQGDAALIISPSGQSILVDGGPFQSVVSQLDEVMPFWDRDIEVVMASHADDDHISGLVSVLQRYRVPTIFHSPSDKTTPSSVRLKQLIEDYGVKEEGFYSRDVLELDGLVIKSWWPDKSRARPDKDSNAISQVVSVSFGDFEVLLTGDAEQKELDQALKEWQGRVEVLKVPHHGSENGLNTNLLEMIQPIVAIISSGQGNRYGHPHQETLQLLSDSGTQVYRTDQQGRIKVIVNKAGFSIYSQK